LSRPFAFSWQWASLPAKSTAAVEARDIAALLRYAGSQWSPVGCDALPRSLIGVGQLANPAKSPSRAVSAAGNCGFAETWVDVGLSDEKRSFGDRLPSRLRLRTAELAKGQRLQPQR
jgi:hypothetical protein